MIFPESFEKRMQEMLGDEYPAFLKSYDRPVNNCIRVNTAKAAPEALLAEMGLEASPVPWTKNGFYIEQKKQFSRHPFYHAGLYYIQEASAMLPAVLVDARPGECILDLCAAPGGKSTAIAAAMKGRGLLVSNDISHSRAKALLRNLEGFGASSCIVTSEYPEKLSRSFPAFFDKVLIDAPCSGEGMFHKEPSMTRSWEKNGPDFYHKLQKEILGFAAAMLKPGGRIVYSTCTFSPQEDEGTIAWFLSEFPEFHLVDPGPSLPDPAGCGISPGRPEWGGGLSDLSKTLRLWPHHLRGEGHFAAVLKKDGDYDGPVRPQAKGSIHKEDLKIFRDFLAKEGIEDIFDKDRLLVQNGYLQYLPEIMPNLKGLHLMRCGWYLGEIKKNRFEPSGAFARGLERQMCRKTISYAPDSEEVIRYLKCETLSVSDELEDGWYLVCTGDYPLGWGKVSRGTLKNKYPSGWRLV